MIELPSLISATGVPQRTRRATLSRLVDGSTALLLVVIAGLIITLALLILFHHNLNATKGYRLRSLELVRKRLITEKEALNMDIARSQSLRILEQDPQLLSMKKSSKILYIEGESVATRSSIVQQLQ